ncbi:MAG: fibronectin type III domain-containing protein [Porticoccaceae bacterium]
MSETIPSSEDSQDESSNEGIAVNAEVTVSPSSNITVGQNVNFTVKFDSAPGLVTIQYGSGLEEKPMGSSEDGLTWTYTRAFDSAGEKTITVRAYDTSSKDNVIDTETINMSVVEGTTPQPAAPTNLFVRPSDGQVSLSWSGVSSETSYRVYYATSSAAVDNATPLNTALTYRDIIGLTNGTQYYFRVTAVNAGNQESTPSSEVSATPMPPVPSAPTNLVARAGNGQVTLTWSVVSDADTYSICYAMQSIETFDNCSAYEGGELLVGIQDTEKTIANLTNVTQYYFRVTAVNAINQESTPSSEVSETPIPPVPSAPTDVTATPDNRQVTLSWSGVSSATSYRVYYATSSAALDNATPLNTPNTNRIISGLTNDTRYYFRVTAVNAINKESTPSREVYATPMPPVPSAPTNITATPSYEQVTLNWSGVTSANRYSICYAEESTTTFDNCRALKDRGLLPDIRDTKKTITKLTNGTEYFFRVIAVDAYNQESAASSEVSSTPLLRVKLNDTGITWGRDYTTGNNSTCEGESETIVAQQDCSHGRDAQAAAGTLSKVGGGAAGFDFTRLNADGSDYAGNGDYASQPWVCVRDNHTGLIWEVKTRDNSIHDRNRAYRWGDKTALVTQQARHYNYWDDLVDDSNGEPLCGFSDWRVPTLVELDSIVDAGRINPSIDSNYFPNTISDWYWSSSPYVGYVGDNNKKLAWYVDFNDGSYRYDGDRRYDHAVRLVRGGQ